MKRWPVEFLNWAIEVLESVFVSSVAKRKVIRAQIRFWSNLDND